ncbi:PAS domain-containing sensor histidine kinase [Marivirga sp.]|uniref:PAS domain-containing sensor histidine kinase n=1 Tax=Marivirga sp. TaxID=2018662 RepID=UPI002D808CFB|nr:PAS domain-containing sensor histidine kinase [Marivirga sp.]HET8858431.1 PAS domain-containing sensor histidine kinase [Marivirga sp.]
MEKENLQIKSELEAVKKKLAQYQYAAAGANEGLWDRNLLTEEVFISPPWITMLGYREDEIQEHFQLWEELMHPEDKEIAVNALNEFIRGEREEYNIQFRLKHKEGHYIWVRSTAKLTLDENGQPIRVSGSHRDITDKRRSEEKIKSSEEKYKKFFQNSLIGIMRVRKEDLNVIEINQKGLNILAMPRLTRHMKMTDSFKEGADFNKFMELLDEKDTLEEFEVIFERWDESETWVSLSALEVEANDTAYYDIIFRDISEFKENLSELQRLNFELDNFVYHASHDIRSPLRSLMGLIEILKTENRPGEFRKIIDMVTGSINRLDKFVVDLLAMSRDDRMVETEAVPVNFMVEVNNSITNFHHVYTTKNLEIRTKIIQWYPFYSDLTKIRIILNNLISNSIKYRKNLEVEFSYINIDIQTNEKEAIILIEDNGEGIPKDKLEKIFEMFYRASENSEGSGLGMYIVKNVIKKLNAKIDVQSEEGEGTKFLIHVPNQYKIEN